ncbi:hypothetical protein BV25DRAFT_1826239 [Artomyces pyxidatus]|uniref:Uncharacterized protein n=1 Tax=Artomyces pyxidatus TaxID=48021 RepID=A0ACB8T0Q4_9AGAM|nr:hypothetical protein BV25DRAFT_1826239 [Artomyces pyxidatus]
MESYPVVPFDVQVEILEWVYRSGQTRLSIDRTTLSVAALVCKAWTPVAQRLLFCHLLWTSASLRIADGITLLRDNPTLGTYVRSIPFIYHRSSQDGSVALTNEKMIALLRLCPYIVDLIFQSSSPFTANELSQIRSLNLPVTVLKLSRMGPAMCQLAALWPTVRFLECGRIHSDATTPIPPGTYAPFIFIPSRSWKRQQRMPI